MDSFGGTRKENNKNNSDKNKYFYFCEIKIKSSKNGA